MAYQAVETTQNKLCLLKDALYKYSAYILS